MKMYMVAPCRAVSGHQGTQSNIGPEARLTKQGLKFKL